MIDPFLLNGLLPIVYFSAIFFYIYMHQKKEGMNRFRGCYLVMAIGFSIELLLAVALAMTWQSDVPGYLVPTSQRIASFFGVTHVLIWGFLFIWLDLIRQYLKLRKTSV